MATKQVQAITQANALIEFMKQFQSLRSSINEFVNQYNSEAYNTTWGNFSTCAYTADGTLGTADGSPNTAHPIDTRVYPSLNSPATQAQLVAAVGFIEDFQKFLSNQAVSTSQRSQTIDDLVS